VYGGGDEPDGEACGKDNPKGEMFSKTGKGDEEKQYARHNSPQCPFAIFYHQVKIAGIIQIKPYEDDQAGERHYSY
jgi:hypothetical protein